MKREQVVAYEPEHGPSCAEDCACREPSPLEQRLRVLEEKVASLGSEPAMASDFNSFQAALRAAAKQGWTHIIPADIAPPMSPPWYGKWAVPKEWDDWPILVKRFGESEYGWWTSATLFEREGRWHIGGRQYSISGKMELPPGAEPLETVKGAREPASDAKLERCVAKVEKQPGTKNAWAICRAALGKEPEPYTRKHLHWHRTPAGTAYYNDDSDYGRITIRQRPSDKPNGKLAWYAVVRKIEVAQAETKAAVQGLVEEHVRHPSAGAGAAEPCVRLVPQGDVDVVRRTPACSPQLGVRVDSPKHLHAAMRERVKGLGDERFWCIGKSKQGEMVGQPVEVAVGQFDSVNVDVAKVIGTAATLRAAGAESVVVCHAHPSGHGHTPSDQDKELTRRIRKGMDAIGVPFDGHYVLSEKHWARC